MVSHYLFSMPLVMIIRVRLIAQTEPVTWGKRNTMFPNRNLFSYLHLSISELLCGLLFREQQQQQHTWLTHAVTQDWHWLKMSSKKTSTHTEHKIMENLESCAATQSTSGDVHHQIAESSCACYLETHASLQHLPISMSFNQKGMKIQLKQI